MFSIYRTLGASALAAAVSIAPTSAPAQTFPTKPIRVVVAYAPGGSTDLAARMIGEELGQALGRRWRSRFSSRSRCSPARSSMPTIAESGLPGYEAVSWQALFAPAKTPQPIVDRLNAGLKQIGESKKLAGKLADNGMELRVSAPAELRELVVREQKKYAAIVKRTGAKTE